MKTKCVYLCVCGVVHVQCMLCGLCAVRQCVLCVGWYMVCVVCVMHVLCMWCGGWVVVCGWV